MVRKRYAVAFGCRTGHSTSESKAKNVPALTNGRRNEGEGYMKLKDYTRGRNDGLALAAKIIEEGGVEALK